MQLVKRKQNKILADLPETCALTDMVTGSTIIVKRGETGYWPMPHLNAELYNKNLGISPAQVEAMRTGSHFGFDIPGADPLNYPDAVDTC